MGIFAFHPWWKRRCSSLHPSARALLALAGPWRGNGLMRVNCCVNHLVIAFNLRRQVKCRVLFSFFVNLHDWPWLADRGKYFGQCGNYAGELDNKWPVWEYLISWTYRLWGWLTLGIKSSPLCTRAPDFIPRTTECKVLVRTRFMRISFQRIY